MFFKFVLLLPLLKLIFIGLLTLFLFFGWDKSRNGFVAHKCYVYDDDDEIQIDKVASYFELGYALWDEVGEEKEVVAKDLNG